MPTSDDVTPGELRRAVEELRKSVDRLSAHVNQLGILEYRIGEAEKDIREVGDQQVRDGERRATDRRLVFTALIAPVLLLIFQVYANTWGAA